ncbi:MAG: Hsp33 family molecular chaperone HslO [Oscillospiraceae bacterium]
MGKLVRVITEDGAVLASAMDSTDAVSEIEKIHKTSAVVTAAMGRLATGAALIGSMMKEAGTSVTLRVDGGGPTGAIIAVSDKEGNVRACVGNPVVELPLNPQGKLDVGGAVGSDGLLSVIKDYGRGVPQTGYCHLVTGEIGDDITEYFASSEQIPTVCALGVLVNPDLTVKAAGGFLLQLLPGASDATIDIIERNLKDMPSVSSMVAENKTPLQILEAALGGFTLQVIDEGSPCYLCDCSKERIERALISLGESEIQDMIEKGEDIAVKCHFCNKIYTFTKENLKKLKKL